MVIITTILVLLVLIDHWLKNRKTELLFYKNDHRFSIVVAVRFYHDNLERLFELAKTSKHQFIFININAVVNPNDYPDCFFIDLDSKRDPSSQQDVTAVLSEAYRLGYKEMTKDFLLFMDANVIIHKAKIIDYMANNLVEHQCFTIKESLVREGLKDAPMLFMDMFKSINCPSECINYHFFAMRNQTYRLAKCHERVFERVSDFETELFKKNITTIHIEHENNIAYTLGSLAHLKQHQHAINYFAQHERLIGVRGMLLVLLAFHIFYASLVIDFSWMAIAAYLITHLALYLALKSHTKHHVFTYFSAPIWLLWFDGVFLFGLSKRFFQQKKRTKQIKHVIESKGGKPDGEVSNSKQEDA